MNPEGSSCAHRTPPSFRPLPTMIWNGSSGTIQKSISLQAVETEKQAMAQAAKLTKLVGKGMPVSVKVYWGQGSAVEIRRFIFHPETVLRHSTSVPAHHSSPHASAHRHPGIYHALLDRIRALYHGLNPNQVNLCWKDDDGDYVVFSSDDELRVAVNNTTDNTLRIYIREKETPRPSVTVAAAPPSPKLGGVELRDSAVGNAVESHRDDRGRHRSRGESSNERELTPCRRAFSRYRINEESTDDNSTSAHHDIVVNHHPPHHYGVPEHSAGHSVQPSSSGSSSSAPTRPTPGTPLCNECGGEGRGVWYKCTVCVPDYFLCSNCENRGLHDHHIMVRTASGPSPSTSNPPNASPR